MSSTPILQRIGNKAKSAADSMKTLPITTGEVNSIHYAQDQADAIAAEREPKQSQQQMPYIDVGSAKSAPYGSRPGEVLYSVDKSGNIAPVAQTPAEPAPATHQTSVSSRQPMQQIPVQQEPVQHMKPIIPQSLQQPMPVYDKGGDVSVEASKRLQSAGDAGIQSFLSAPAEHAQAPAPASAQSTAKPITSIMDNVNAVKSKVAEKKTTFNDKGGETAPNYMRSHVGAENNVAAPAMPVIPLDTSRAPKLYDDGGDVDVNDGKHQVAVLQDGEKVLTPAQADQYRKEHPSEGSKAPASMPKIVVPESPMQDIYMPHVENAQKVQDKLQQKQMHDEYVQRSGKETNMADNNPPSDTKALAQFSGADNSLKPYSQVVEDKAKQKAAEQVNNPGIKPIVADTTETQVAPKEEERGTPAERKAINTDIQNAMGKGVNGFTQLGTALIQKNALPKIDTDKLSLPDNLSLPDKGGPTPQQRAPQGNPQGGVPVTNGPTNPQPSGKETYKAKVAQYDSQYQQLMDKAAETGDPQFSEKAERVKAAKESYLQAHPWGSPESAHPGILGRIGHITEQVLSRAPVSSKVMPVIPGSEGYRNAESAATQANLKEQAAQNVAEQNANTKEAKNGEDWAPIPKPILNPATGNYEEALYSKHDPSATPRFTGKVAPTPTAGSDKKDFESTLAKIGTKDVSDPGQQKAALETAHKNKVITDQEYAQANAYLGSTANAPATQATAAEQKRTAGKTMYFDTPTGRKAFTAAEAKDQGFDPSQGVNENEGQVAKDREKANTFNVIEKSLSQYEKHVAEAKLTPKDVEVMGTITEEAEGPDYISKLIGGAFDDLLGHPITGYSEKLMKGTLNKNQYQDLSPAGRQLVADYYTTMMAHFANMKAAQGTIPRNPAIIKTEMNTIPKPFLSEEEAKPAFQNYLEQVAMRNHDNVDFSGAKGVKKEEPVAPPVPTGATDEVLKDGKVIGHVVAGKYQPLQQ